MQEIRIIRTQDISKTEWVQYVKGFNECFPKRVMTEDKLFAKYSANHFGFSYHALCFEDDRIIGSLSASPYWYKYHDTRIKVALTCDIFIVKEKRSDIKLFANLNKALKDFCEQEGIICFLGVANENAYTYTLRILRCKEIMTLPYWILPLRISNVTKRRWMKSLNFISLGLAYVSLGINHLISKLYNSKEKEAICKLDVTSDFIRRRLPDSKYTNCHNDNFSYSYVVTNDEDIRCAYIMMINECGVRSSKALCKCIAHIIRNERVDMVMFNGSLNICQGLLIKTPEKLEPRKIHLTVNFMNKEYEKDYHEILNHNGIDFTLLNLDVR